MIEPEAMKRLASAIAALELGNHAAAERDLAYAAEEWPNQCDVHRALAYSRQSRLQVPTEARAIAKIRTALGTFDEMIASIPGGSVEDSFTINWSMPLAPVIFPLATRGQVRAAYASQLVEDKQYDEAFDELKAARNEKLFTKALAGTTAKEIAAVECLLYYRTDRWDDLIRAASALTSAASADELEQVFASLGNAFSGAALAHLGSHDAAQTKLQYSIAGNFSEVSAWASLQLGLSHRTAGDEEAAQKALSAGMQYKTLPELQHAMQNKSVTLRVSTAEVIAARESYWDRESEPDIADFQRQSSQEDRAKVLKEALAELEAMDGMDGIKEQVRTLSSEVMFENEQRRRGMNVKPKTRHLIFKGPPGTGKTTIANLIVRLYYGLGVIRNHTLISANRAALVGQVEGESAQKTLARLKEARGGVIFIDEAYEVVQNRGGQTDPFGSEALTTLLEYMDNHRDDIIVIIAGYEAPIERFLGENPGLKSRFAYSLSFTTYSPDEMWRILTGMAKKEGRTVDPSVEDKFKQAVDIMWGTDQRGQRVLDVAGNGRFARNVFEQAQGLSSRRLMTGGADLAELSDEQFLQLQAEDILGATANILKGFGITHVA
ncbi:type VII secretion AAA-ATPase EccA [Mycobacteroides abscessus subsp. abscessus]|uniref:AAA family ATPase n=2 Tax=Mycobacteroides abscessus TaxID=36809 RepID=UPI00092A3B1D|nr:AAA family ATPase [Mycobacteroides abscessus]MDO3312521.1 AAA family ATPase [Mycobacteroides abscessus subsp. abscessus]MDO3344797.1 AAA family ATPase [Mycobacteroides abscessus subsp. abscessus]SHP05099.1 type VII secretion AAA-ATPase EccA [Mycobacteroides abscessus subsp. abscessus]SHP19884.1 type VII secretion AAA-ATPase EccA [Mycobacteroides abscessus subsp. abscessus]SHP90885.1 type VII secretion AAA-ATPase EccA [Mycobacteroides abscessus subsp. abscessus]